MCSTPFNYSIYGEEETEEKAINDAVLQDKINLRQATDFIGPVQPAVEAKEPAPYEVTSDAYAYLLFEAALNDIRLNLSKVSSLYSSGEWQPKELTDYYIRSLRENKAAIEGLVQYYNQNRQAATAAYLEHINNQISTTLDILTDKYTLHSSYSNAAEFKKDVDAYTEQFQAKVKKWKTLLGDYDPEKDYETAHAGWSMYLADKEQQENESFAQQMGETYTYLSSDSTLPVSTILHAYQEDTAYREPNDQWTEDQCYAFGFLYYNNQDKAWEYAIEMNNALNAVKKAREKQEISADATSNFGNAALHSLGAVLGGVTGLADWTNEALESIARGVITEKEYMTPFEYSQTVVSSVTDRLNKYGTLDQDIPVIGGRGAGDIYSLGVNAAQSLIGTYTQSGLLIFFGSSAAAALDDALARGAGEEKAIAYSILVGLAETIPETIVSNKLLNTASSQTLKDMFFNVLKQGGFDALGGSMTSVISLFADDIVMGDFSQLNQLTQQYKADGVSEEEARKQAQRDIVNQIAYDVLAEFTMGEINTFIHTGFQALENNINALRGNAVQEVINKGLESSAESNSRQLAESLQKKTEIGETVLTAELYRLIVSNEQQLRAKNTKAATAKIVDSNDYSDTKAAETTATERQTEEIADESTATDQRIDELLKSLQASPTAGSDRVNSRRHELPKDANPQLAAIAENIMNELDALKAKAKQEAAAKAEADRRPDAILAGLDERTKPSGSKNILSTVPINRNKQELNSINNGHSVKSLSKPVDNLKESKQKIYIDKEIGLTTSKSDDIMAMNRKEGNSGAFAKLSEKMSKKHIRDVAKKYGVDLQGITLSIEFREEWLRSLTVGRADSINIGLITFFPNAFQSEEVLLRTLYHEKMHVKQFRQYGVEYVQNNRKYFEDITYAAEDEFINRLKKKGVII